MSASLFLLLLAPVAWAQRETLGWGALGDFWECGLITLLWSGGVPPYFVAVKPENADFRRGLFSSTNASWEWIARDVPDTTLQLLVDYPTGTLLNISVWDSGTVRRMIWASDTVKEGDADAECSLWVPLPTRGIEASDISPTASNSSVTNSTIFTPSTNISLTASNSSVTNSSIFTPSTNISPTASNSSVTNSSIFTPSSTDSMPTASSVTSSAIFTSSTDSMPTASSNAAGEGSIDTGAIVGGVVAGVLGLALIIGAVVVACLYLRRRDRPLEQYQDTESVIDDTELMAEVDEVRVTPYPTPPPKGASLLSTTASGPSTGVGNDESKHVLQWLTMGTGREEPHARDAGPAHEQLPPRYDLEWSGTRRS